jgi:signal transduction histidine kinase/ActR/RegA family two-component response regulator
MADEQMPVAPLPQGSRGQTARDILQDIAVDLIASPDDAYLSDFVQAAGQRMQADMVLISRIKSMDQPVVAYAIYDRSARATHYEYPLGGTPCQAVFQNNEPFVSIGDLQRRFPEDADLVTFGLNTYVGMPLNHDGACFGLIAALWQGEVEDPELYLDVFRHLEPRLTVGVLRHDERLEAQQSLKSELTLTSRRLEIALSASQIGVWDFDIGLQRVRFDERIRALYGQAAGQLECSYPEWLQAVHRDDRNRVETGMRKAIETETSFNGQFRIVRPDGEHRTIRAAGGVVQTGTADRQLIGCSWDGTKDVEIQAELIQRRREAEAASEAKTRFLANMSHELRTPLNGLLGMTQLLHRTELTERQQMYANTIQSSGKALVELIDGLLDISNIESGLLMLRNDEFSLSELVRESVRIVESSAQAKSLALTVDIAADLDVAVLGDSKRLKQVLLNLLSNAIKFTNQGGVTVRVEAVGQTRVRFAVEDTGPGISENQRDLIFERFAQGDNSTTRRHGGSGLGLAIASEIVALAGGVLTVDSQVGEGSCFWFEIDLTRSLVSHMVEDAGAHQPIRASINDRRDRVLVVEDIAANALVVQDMLELGGYQSLVARNGLEALNQLAEGQFAAVLMDIHMPVMTGDEAIRRIRNSDQPWAQIPIYALTADATPGTQERLLALGASRYFAKPIDLVHIIDVLDRDLESDTGN